MVTRQNSTAIVPGGLRPPLALFCVVALLLTGALAVADDWIFDQSEYSNNKVTGQRVDQYQKIKPVDRIPFSKYFSEDGPHPFELYSSGYGSGYGYGYGYGYGAFAGGMYPFYGPYPNASPMPLYGPALPIAPGY
jgi:hypothetical protein